MGPNLLDIAVSIPTAGTSGGSFFRTHKDEHQLDLLPVDGMMGMEGNGSEEVISNMKAIYVYIYRGAERSGCKETN